MDFNEKNKELEMQKAMVEESLKNTPRTRQELKDEANAAKVRKDYVTMVTDLVLVHEIDDINNRE
ncbi:MAG: hypothetical protein LBP37_06545 [Spirochaetaceae bacterium]|jgi:hypothetical protein|nr:hypothetical protein [Spirochaetaceae bacterium]